MLCKRLYFSQGRGQTGIERRDAVFHNWQIAGAAAVLLAGCSGSQIPPALQPATTGAASAGKAERVGSWMASDAGKLDLLYVSDYETNDVYAYSYPDGKLSGVLKDILDRFVLPTGLCADATGDVFIPDSSNSTVLEYAHGSTTLLHTLLDLDELPYSCAVDPMTGNLAVVNLESAFGPGGVSIYRHARGRPKSYSDGSLYKYYFGGFDDAGNLFVDASYAVPSEPFAFVELPRGSTSLESVTLDQSFNVPGGVGWDGKYVVVGDSKTSVLYRFAVSGSVGTKVGSTRLRQGRFVTQFLFADNGVVAANFKGASASFWIYPGGGAPAKIINGLGEPFGIALSKAHR
jgi:hypothetical protein